MTQDLFLRTVTVMRYILPLREGGSLPALAEADDDFKYVLKFRGAVKEYLVAFVITIAFIGLVMASLLGVYYSEVVLKLFTPQINISWLVDNMAKIIGFISFPIFYFILLALFYWVGCLKITSFKQAIPGAILTTILFVLLTYFFAIYVRDFARYNVLYGSIGSIILVMVWVNINIILILLGNELNIAIKKVRVEKMISDEMNSGNIANYIDSDLKDPITDSPSVFTGKDSL